MRNTIVLCYRDFTVKKTTRTTLLESAKTCQSKKLAKLRDRTELAVAYFKKEITGKEAAAAIKVNHHSVSSRLSAAIGSALANGIVDVTFNEPSGR